MSTLIFIKINNVLFWNYLISLIVLVILMECRHVSKFKISPNHSVFSPENWICTACGTSESVWACLHCSNVACGRYIEQHALKHHEKVGHSLCIEINDLFVFCYSCNDYVLNDNAAGDLKLLRSILSSLHSQSFSVCETRSGRVLRSVQPSVAELKQRTIRLNREDLALNAVYHRRICLLRRTFFSWKDRSIAGAQQSQRIKREIQNETANANSKKRKLSAQVDINKPNGKRRRAKLVLSPGVLGLRNLGNTCYINSILQVLGHLEPVKKLFLHKMESFAPKSKSIKEKDFCDSLNMPFKRLSTLECLNKVSSPLRSKSTTAISLTEELHALMRVMWSGKHHLVAPSGILNGVWLNIPYFRGHSQQDAQEFLSEFLEKIEYEESMQRIFSKGNMDTLISAYFQGELVSRVHCLVCKSKSEVKEIFTDLSLEFPARFHSSRSSIKELCSLDEILSLFTSSEQLGKVYSCASCNASRTRSTRKGVLCNAQKRLSISQLPHILRLHLKRFRWIGRCQRDKINTTVTFPNILDMAPYCDEQKSHSNTLYKLQAVVIHHGRGFRSGHYTAYCWNCELKFWMHFNDSKFERCTLEEVQLSQAYILFYIKSVDR